MGVQVDPNMLQAEKWPILLNSKFNYINFSAHNNKKSYGFDKSRIFQWKNSLEEWELVLVQYLLRDYLRKLNYEILDCDQSLLRKGLKIIENDDILKKNFYHYQNTNEGTDTPLNDPSKPENWGATDTSKNIKAKFVETDDYNNYLNEMSKIRKK